MSFCPSLVYVLLHYLLLSDLEVGYPDLLITAPLLCQPSQQMSSCRMFLPLPYQISRPLAFHSECEYFQMAYLFIGQTT